ncbi:MAG: type VII secretion protein EccB [Carbonactinosporaceae bacterium]
MMNERDRAEAQTLRRRRLVLAFRLGSDRPSLLDEPRHNRTLGGGAGMAVLCMLGAGIFGVVDAGPPDDWKQDGNVVVAEGSATRFLIDDGKLRQIVNETGLRLALGGTTESDEAVTVDQKVLARLPVGEAIGSAEMPSTPPEIDALPRYLTCVRGQQVSVVIGREAPASSPESPQAAVVYDGRGYWLLSGGKRFDVTDAEARARLGYDVSDVVPVPPGLVADVPEGPAMTPVELSDDGEAAGDPEYLSAGALVADEGDGALYVASEGALHPVPNRTSLQLIYGPELPERTEVSSDVLRTAPVGRALGSSDWPDAPPPPSPAAARAWTCSSNSGDVAVMDMLPKRNTTRTPGAADISKATIWQASGPALLVGTSRAAREPSAGAPAVLIAEGRGFPIEDSAALSALGYDGSRLQVVPASWLRMMPLGAPLERIEID